MATLVRWDPFREIAALQNDLSRFMSAVRDGDGDGGQWVPAVDVWETDEEVVYSFDLPGIPEDKISVELEDNTLTVSAERERTKEVAQDSFYRFERRFGTLSRTIRVPQGIDEDAIKADYHDGVLELRIAKPEQPKPRRIQIGGGSQATIEGKAAQSES